MKAVSSVASKYDQSNNGITNRNTNHDEHILCTIPSADMEKIDTASGLWSYLLHLSRFTHVCSNPRSYGVRARNKQTLVVCLHVIWNIVPVHSRNSYGVFITLEPGWILHWSRGFFFPSNDQVSHYSFSDRIKAAAQLVDVPASDTSESTKFSPRHR